MEEFTNGKELLEFIRNEKYNVQIAEVKENQDVNDLLQKLKEGGYEVWPNILTSDKGVTSNVFFRKLK